LVTLLVEYKLFISDGTMVEEETTEYIAGSEDLMDGFDEGSPH
jgi:hypothetical protein